MNILNTLRKNNTVKSCVYEERPVEFISTGCYTLNILFSGQLFGGIQIGRMSSVVSPPSLGKCSRGTEEIDIIISDEAFEKYFKNKVNYKILE